MLFISILACNRVVVRENKVEFLLIVERGALEAQACLLVESIRRFAGRYAACPISVISPRADWRPGTGTIARLQAAGAAYHPLNLASRVPEYGTSFRVLAADWLARRPGPDIIVQLDSDTLFVAEPDFELGDAIALARPVDETGMASTGPDDPRDQHWQAMAKACAVPLDRIGWTQTTVCRSRIRASYNGGLVAGRRVLFRETKDCFDRIVDADARSWPHRQTGVRAGAGLTSAAGYAWWGTSQAAISLAAARLGGRIDELDPTYNVPLHLIEQAPLAANRPPVHLHYHWLFASAAQASRLPGALFGPDDALHAWLGERLPLDLRSIEGTGVFSPDLLPLPSGDGLTGRADDVPTCSVVMTAFTDTRFLNQAVDSVLAQDFTDFELIVVDDGSPDPNPVAALAGRDPRIRVLRLDQNCGAAESANRGIAITRSPLIARLDSDDLAEPNWLSSAIAALRQDPELGLVGSAVTLIDEQGRRLGLQAMPQSDFAIRFTLLFHSPFYHSTTLYYRSLFDAVGGYRADRPVSMDTWLWAALLPRTRARNLPQPLVRYRINSQGLTAQNAPFQPRARTMPIRTALWREIGLRRCLEDTERDAAASALLRGTPGATGLPRMAAAELIATALDRVRHIAPDFLRRGEEQDTADYAEDLLARMRAYSGGPGLLVRAFGAVKREGVAATLIAATRKIGRKIARKIGRKIGHALAHRLPHRRTARPLAENPVMAALHPASPYAGFDPSPYAHQAPAAWTGDCSPLRLAIARWRPKLIIDLGCRDGLAAIHMANLCMEFALDTRIVCVDAAAASHGQLLANALRAGHAGRIIPLGQTSDEASAALRARHLRPELIHLAWQGDAPECIDDLAIWSQLLAPGGIIAGFAHADQARPLANLLGLAIETRDGHCFLRKDENA